MDQREVVRQRIMTLDGLLDAPGGPFGEGGGDLADQLAEGWKTEKRLLERILRETRGDDVAATLDRWYERTAAFVEKAEDDEPSWDDRHGNTWDAVEVLRLLDDFRRRLDVWLAEARRMDAQTSDADDGGSTEERDDPDDDDQDYISVLDA